MNIIGRLSFATCIYAYYLSGRLNDVFVRRPNCLGCFPARRWRSLPMFCIDYLASGCLGLPAGLKGLGGAFLA